MTRLVPKCAPSILKNSTDALALHRTSHTTRSYLLPSAQHGECRTGRDELPPRTRASWVVRVLPEPSPALLQQEHVLQSAKSMRLCPETQGDQCGNTHIFMRHLFVYLGSHMLHKSNQDPLCCARDRLSNQSCYRPRRGFPGHLPSSGPLSGVLGVAGTVTAWALLPMLC